MVKVMLTHLGCFDPKPLLTDPLRRSSNWFCHCRPQPLCTDSELELKLFQAVRVADSQQSWKHFLMLVIRATDSPLMACTPTFLSSRWGGTACHTLRTEMHHPFMKMIKPANDLICGYIRAVSAKPLCSSLSVVLRLGFTLQCHGCRVTAAKRCHGGVTKEHKCD